MTTPAIVACTPEAWTASHKQMPERHEQRRRREPGSSQHDHSHDDDG